MNAGFPDQPVSSSENLVRFAVQVYDPRRAYKDGTGWWSLNPGQNLWLQRLGTIYREHSVAGSLGGSRIFSLGFLHCASGSSQIESIPYFWCPTHAFPSVLSAYSWLHSVGILHSYGIWSPVCP